MASTSAIQKSFFKYDVFLSFRGEDTRKNFVDHLYHALKKENIITYRDDEEIKKGEMIGDELIGSIEDSRFYIIVFSKNYASSSWCLDELVKIMECQKTNNEHTAYPVFYDVEPTQVRKQSGAVGEAFDKHKDKEAAGKWRDVLREAADLAGWELKNIFDGHESELIQKIVQEISQKLRFINMSVDGKLVGMVTRVTDIVSSLEIDNVKDVRMIGIKGMGGAGKTTLARAVFDQISFRFEGSSFVENVRETSKNSLCGLKSLQKQVLSDVLNNPDITVRGVSDLKSMMRHRKVFVVLDDVDHIDQLESLVGELDWFKPGSRVVITTRDEQVLIAHGVPKNLILPVNLLSYEEANCLFNRYAFGSMIPNQYYEKLSCQVVSYAAGLPLTIKVLGSELRGKDEIEWKDTLERLKTIPLNKTLKMLELSYDSLEEDHKEIFLDVACMLKGWEKETAIRALESCGFHARSGLKVLELKSLVTVIERKSLVTLSVDEFLGMHDHIEEMGKNIVRRLHPNEPHRHSRLWIGKEVDDVLDNNKGTEITRCLKVGMVDVLDLMKGLRKMKELRFLEARDIPPFFHEYSNELLCQYLKSVPKCSLYLPDSLQYLRWYGYPFDCLPEEFQANNLAGIEMKSGNMDQLWKEGKEKVLKKLKFLDLGYCKLRTLDMRLMLNLERLTLVACENLVQLHMPVESFKLKYLELNHSKLMALNLAHAQNLDTLKVKNCENLVELHMPDESLKLKLLNLQSSKLKTLNLARYQNLETLDLKCKDLVELHLPNDSPKLKHCNLQLSKLKTLNLTRSNNLETLDLGYIGQAQYLEKLYIYEDLVELHLPVKELKHLSLRFCSVRTLNLTQNLNLETLDLECCEDLEEIHMPISTFNLKSLNLCCSKLRNLNIERAQYLEKLTLENNDDLVELHMPVESPKLNTINIHCSMLWTLYLGLSPYLEHLNLDDCCNLVEIHARCRSGCLVFKPIFVNQRLSVGSLAELHLMVKSLDMLAIRGDLSQELEINKG